MTPDELLDQAADTIEARGWTQGTYLGTDGSMCAFGALRWVAGDRSIFASHRMPGALRQACHALMDEVDSPTWRKARISRTQMVMFDISAGYITDWNDSASNDAEHVTTMMRHAAKRLRGGA